MGSIWLAGDSFPVPAASATHLVFGPEPESKDGQGPQGSDYTYCMVRSAPHSVYIKIPLPQHNLGPRRGNPFEAKKIEYELKHSSQVSDGRWEEEAGAEAKRWWGGRVVGLTQQVVLG